MARSRRLYVWFNRDSYAFTEDSPWDIERFCWCHNGLRQRGLNAIKAAPILICFRRTSPMSN
jgi:hypothetical protein